MAERSGFFNATNSTNPDRVYDSSDFAAYFASFIGNGVFAAHSDQLRVAQQSSPDMSVQVLAGQAWINGWWYENTAPLTLSIDAADGTLDRIDIIVVQFNLTNREIKILVRKGTPSAGATAPTLNRDDDLWELKLAEIDVSHGTVNITDGKVTDTRSNSEVCGWVSGVVDQMDTTELFNQLKEATQEAVDAMNDALDGSTEGDLKAHKKSLLLTNNISGGTDLNTLTEAGNYSCSAEDSATVVNKPVDVTGAFMLFVYEQQGGVTFQELFDMSSPKVYTRVGSGEWQGVGTDKYFKESSTGNGVALNYDGVLAGRVFEKVWEGNVDNGGRITMQNINKYRMLLVQTNYSSLMMLTVRPFSITAADNDNIDYVDGAMLGYGFYPIAGSTTNERINCFSFQSSIVGDNFGPETCSFDISRLFLMTIGANGNNAVDDSIQITSVYGVL